MENRTTTIVIAEDDPAIQQILDEMLAEEGYRTVLVGDGAASIAAVRRLKRDSATAAD